jgi:EAL and modified HD-GYP domain-containing signal transduction protein
MSSGAVATRHASGDTAVIVGRQPIVDRDGRVVAFELLYRSRQPHPAGDMSGHQMTARVLLGAMTIGFDQLVGGQYMFCNADRSFLLSDTPVTLPPERTVIEVLETVEVDDEVVAACRQLVASGFRLALDDFVWMEGAERLLDLATVVKVDVQACTREEILELAQRCRPYGVKLLAEKVETEDDVAWAREQGFDLFQGYAIERPALVHGRSVGTSVLTRAKLATTMLTEDLDLEEIEDVLRHEPGLVVQLLQLASIGAGHGMRRPVRTVREAMVLLGTTRIRQWVALTLLDSGPTNSPDGLATALTRARTAELLARGRGLPDPEFAFTAGLLSSLDLLLGLPLDELAATMEIAEDLKRAAFERSGQVGELLAEIVGFEASLHGLDGADGSSDDLDAAAADAFAWAMPYVSGLAAA